MDWKKWFRRSESGQPRNGANTKRFSEAEIDGGLVAASTGEAGLFDQYELGVATSPTERERFREAVARRMIVDVIADDDISDEEFARLEKVQRALAISDDYLSEIQNGLIGPLLTADIHEAMKDGRVSDEEMHGLFARAKRLGTELSITGSGAEEFFRMWDYFKWERGDLPSVPCHAALQSGEVAHWSDHATLAEKRTVRQRVGYSGVSLSIPIVRGVRYRVGNVSPISTSSEQIVRLDEGELAMTSKRVLFVGGHTSKSFTWKSVVSVTPYSDALAFARATGKHQIFFVHDAKSAAVMASVLMARE